MELAVIVFIICATVIIAYVVTTIADSIMEYRRRKDIDYVCNVHDMLYNIVVKRQNKKSVKKIRYSGK